MRAAVPGRGLRAPRARARGPFSFTRPGASGVMPGRRTNRETIIILMIVNAFLMGVLVGSVMSWRVLP